VIPAETREEIERRVFSEVVIQKIIEQMAEDEGALEYTREELLALYEEFHAEPTRLIDGTILFLPDEVLFAETGSRVAGPHKRWMARLRGIWRNEKISGEELLGKLGISGDARDSVTNWESEPYENIYHKYQEALDRLPEGEISGPIRLPRGWGLVRYESSKEGRVPLDHVESELRAKLRNRKLERYREGLRKELLDQYDFQLLIKADDFSWDSQANKLTLETGENSG